MSLNGLSFLSDEPSDFSIYEREYLPIDNFALLLDYFSSYLSAIEKFLKHGARDLRDSYQNSNEIDVLASIVYNEELVDYFPDLLRKSLFMAIYSGIETELIRWCDRAQKRKQLQLTARELAGSVTEKCKTYITKVVGIQLPQAEWEKLKDYEMLRHFLLHAQGHLDLFNKKDAPHLEDYIRQQPYLDFQTSEVTMYKGYCEEVIENSALFFKKLDEAFTRS